MKRRNQQVEWRQGWPIFAALGGLLLVSVGIGLGVHWLAPRDPGMSEAVVCLSNLRALRVGLMAYAADHDHRLPPGDWAAALQPYEARAGELACPLSEKRPSYQLNSTLQSRDLQWVTDPPTAALLWDVGLHPRPEPGSGPHQGRYAVVTLGGTGMLTSGRDTVADSLRFTP